MSMIGNDDFILVRKSDLDKKDVKPADDSKEEKKRKDTQSFTVNASSSGCSSSSCSDVKAIVRSPGMDNLSDSVLNAMQRIRMSSKKGKGKFSSDHVTTTTLSSYWDDAVPSSAVLNYSLYLRITHCAEWTGFQTLYEQYKVLSVKLETWTGGITPNNTRTSLAAHMTGLPIMENVLRSPTGTIPTMLKLADQPGAHFLDYGYNKNLHTMHYKPDGTYVLDSGTSGNWVHQVGWMDTVGANDQNWGLWVQQSPSAGLVDTTGFVINRRITYVVAFRRRRDA